jgi:membrane-associated phospholipid phosphatase
VKRDAETPPVASELEVPDSWLVSASHRWPALQRMARNVDRRVWGGATVVLGFGVVLAAALAVGWILSTVDSDRGFARWDESVAEWGSDRADSVTVSVLQAVTHLGGSPWLVATMVVIGVVEWRRRGNATSLWFLLAVGLGILAVNNGLKRWIMRERPPVDHLVGASGSAFPSGHSAAAAACWLAIALVAARWFSRRAWPWLAAIAVGIALAVAASRALLGVHWLTDVLAGLLVGWAWFVVVAVAFGGRLQRLGEPAERLATVTESDRQEVDHGR